MSATEGPWQALLIWRLETTHRVVLNTPRDSADLPMGPGTAGVAARHNNHSPKVTMDCRPRTHHKTKGTATSHGNRPGPLVHGLLWSILLFINEGKSEAAQGIWGFFPVSVPETPMDPQRSRLSLINSAYRPQAPLLGHGPSRVVPWI